MRYNKIINSLILTQTTLFCIFASANKLPATALEDATSPRLAGIPNVELSDDLKTPVIQRSFFVPFEQVIKNLHASVEKETDIVYLVNTSDKQNQCSDNMSSMIIPNQHMVILKRTSASQPLFTRNSNGMITGVDQNAVQVATLQSGQDPIFKYINSIKQNETSYIPVSTGIPGGKKILTYSGIFRINESRTNDRRKSTNTAADPMQYSVYINGEYSDGGEARLALHGTPQRFWGLLGKQRASSGCIRLQTDFSRWNQALLFNKASDGQLVPKPELTDDIHVWSRRDHYPVDEQNFQSLMKAKKLKVLVIFFDGYNMRCS